MVPADDPSITLAERVAEEARALGIETALIGAAALAVHNYVRATEDLDLASYVNPGTGLKALAERLRTLGHDVHLSTPDEEDDLGGVLNVRASPDGALVQVVNFLNPLRLRRSPAPAAIANARPVPGTTLRCVALPDLVALKLDANGPDDRADVRRLLANNPDADLEAVRRACADAGLEARLDALPELR